MRTRDKHLFHIVVALILAAIVMMGVSQYWNHYHTKKMEPKEKTVVTSKKEIIPIKEKNTITRKEIKSKIFEIGELSTYSCEYSQTLGKSESKYFSDDIKIPFTTNHVEVSCDGVVKVGYNLSDITVNVDNYHDVIYIQIPEANVTNNYIIMDSVKTNDENNIFNPINYDQYDEIFAEIKKTGLEEAINKGVYEKAEDNLKKLLYEFLSEFDEYNIKYV